MSCPASGATRTMMSVVQDDVSSAALSGHLRSRTTAGVPAWTVRRLRKRMVLAIWTHCPSRNLPTTSNITHHLCEFGVLQSSSMPELQALPCHISCNFGRNTMCETLGTEAGMYAYRCSADALHSLRKTAIRCEKSSQEFNNMTKHKQNRWTALLHNATH